MNKIQVEFDFAVNDKNCCIVVPLYYVEEEFEDLYQRVIQNRYIEEEQTTQ